MLLEIGVADSYGIAFEFVKNYDKHSLVNNLTYQQNPRYPELIPSQYTDDTLRSVATAMVVTGQIEGSIFSLETYARAIQHVTKTDHRKGWSKNFQKYLEDHEEDTPDDFVKGITTRANSNGSLMGCLPLGYLGSEVEVELSAAAQALSTHSVETVPYAQTMALSAYFLINGGKASELDDYIKSKGFAVSGKTKPFSMAARDTAFNVLHLLRNSNSLVDIMKQAVDMQGDVDSIAALAVGIASCSPYYTNDIPAHLIDQLDGGKGAEYLATFDKALSK